MFEPEDDPEQGPSMDPWSTQPETFDSVAVPVRPFRVTNGFRDTVQYRNPFARMNRDFTMSSMVGFQTHQYASEFGSEEGCSSSTRSASPEPVMVSTEVLYPSFVRHCRLSSTPKPLIKYENTSSQEVPINWNAVSIGLKSDSYVDSHQFDPPRDYRPILDDYSYYEPFTEICLGDSEMRRGARKMWLGPTLSSLFHSHWLKGLPKGKIEDEPFDMTPYLSRLYAASASTDPFALVQIALPDPFYYEDDVEELRERLINPVVEQILEEETTVSVPDCNYKLLLRGGAQPSICWHSDVQFDPLSVVFDTCRLEDDVQRLILDELHFMVQSITPLTREQRTVCYEQLEWPVSERACRIRFFSQTDLERFTHTYEPLCRSFPILLERAECPSRKLSTSLKLAMRWYIRPSKGRAKLVLRHAEDVRRCQAVLLAHDIETRQEMSDGEAELTIFWTSYTDLHLIAHDEKALRHVVTKILAANSIEMERVNLLRFEPSCKDSATYAKDIHRRLLCAALNADAWTGYVPEDEQQWTEFLDDAQQTNRLPWRVKVAHVSKRDVEGDAEVFFSDRVLGEVIVNYLVGLNRSEVDVFRLNRMDRCGVRLKPTYVVDLPFPNALRNIFDKEIRSMDESERVCEMEVRRESIRSIPEWSRIVDTEERDRIVIEGYPHSRVIDLSVQLKSLLEDRSIDCSDLNANGKLLYGCGSQWVECVRREMMGVVLMHIDLFQQRIRIFGPEEAKQRAVDRVMMFVRESDKFVVDGSICISFPRFIPSSRRILGKIGIAKLTECVGGGRLRMHNKTIRFEGTLPQYERLNEILEELDKELTLYVDRVPDQSEHRPVCPVCLSATLPSYYSLDACGHYYCLPCIVMQLRNDISSRKLPLRCCAEDCEQKIAIKDIKKLLIGESCQLPRWFISSEGMNQLVRSAIDCIVRDSGGEIRLCPSADCFGLHKPSSFNVSGDNGPMTCSYCGEKRCARCFVEPHPGVDCDKYAEIRADANLSLAVFRKAKGDKVKNCPNPQCSVVIEKTHGCNHMECTVCKIHFCWICSFSSTAVNTLYSHMETEHGGTGGGWVIENGIIVEGPEQDNDLILF